jgi:hypothetical protein
MAIQFLSSLTITGTTSVSSISNDNSSYTGILVWDGGLLKYRTKSQILSDIGATNNEGTVTSVGLGTLAGISGSVSNSTTDASISLENTDRGSSQNIFKSIIVQGQTSITASSNTDSIKFAASGATTITTTSLTNTVNIDSRNYYIDGLSFDTGNGVLTASRLGLSDLTVDLDGRYATGTIPTNNNQLTNGAGYTTNTGTTTASNAQTFTNKGGNISQWTNNSGYITSASMTAAKGSWYPSAVQNISSGGTVGTRTTLSLNTASITAVGMSLSSSVVTITDEITALISMNFASKNYATANRTLAGAVVQYRLSGEEWFDLQGTQVYNYDRGTATSGGASTWGFVYNGSGGASVLNVLEGESELRVQFWIEGRASSASGISSVIAGCRLSITEIK